MTIAGTHSGASGTVARAHQGPPAVIVVTEERRVASRVVVSWGIGVDVLARVRPEGLRGASGGRLEIVMEEGARASARVAVLGGPNGITVLSASPFAESLRIARGVLDPVADLQHLDVPGFAAVTWRLSASGPRLLYARSALLGDLGIGGGKLDGAVGEWP